MDEKMKVMMKLKETLKSMTEKKLLLFIALKLTIGADLDIRIHKMNLNIAKSVKEE